MPMSLTPGFSPVGTDLNDVSRFNGFRHRVKAAEAAQRPSHREFTGLKPGVNETAVKYTA
jgi:hypothetical protein